MQGGVKIYLKKGGEGKAASLPAPPPRSFKNYKYPSPSKLCDLSFSFWFLAGQHLSPELHSRFRCPY